MRNKTNVIICILLWGLFGGVYVWLHIRYYAYIYPTIMSSNSFMLLTIPGLLIPAIPLIVISVWGIRRTTVLYIGIILFLLITPLMLLVQEYELFANPSVCSFTDEPEHFGAYDSRVEEILRLNLSDDFPDQIPDEAKNVKYCYWYEYPASGSLYIGISWTCSDNAFSTIIETYAESKRAQIPSGGEMIYLYDPDANILPYLRTVIFLDFKTNTVAYVTTTKEGLIPNSIDDIVKEPAQLFSQSLGIE